MMNRALLPCRSCARHVRATDSACPFCGSAVPEQTRMVARPQAPRGNLSRAALFALGAAAAAAGTTGIAGCSGGVVSVQDASGDVVSTQDAYGGPPPHDVGPSDSPGDVDSAQDAPRDVFMAHDAYGAPPPDVGPKWDASAADAGSDVIQAMYGGPPP